MLAQPGQFLLGDPLAGEPDAEAFQRGAHLVQLAHLLLGELAHEPAAVRQLHDQAVTFHPVQRFANRRRADVELLGDGVGTELHARLDVAADDAGPQRPIGARAQQSLRQRLESRLLRPFHFRDGLTT